MKTDNWHWLRSNIHALMRTGREILEFLIVFCNRIYWSVLVGEIWILAPSCWRKSLSSVLCNVHFVIFPHCPITSAFWPSLPPPLLWRSDLLQAGAELGAGLGVGVCHDDPPPALQHSPAELSTKPSGRSSDQEVPVHGSGLSLTVALSVLGVTLLVCYLRTLETHQTREKERSKQLIKTYTGTCYEPNLACAMVYVYTTLTRSMQSSVSLNLRLKVNIGMNWSWCR